MSPKLNQIYLTLTENFTFLKQKRLGVATTANAERRKSQEEKHVHPRVADYEQRCKKLVEINIE